MTTTNNHKQRRTDAWTTADDETLARIVLDSISSGGTQHKAFEDAGKTLNRTAAACGFRWHGVLRNRYAEKFHEAKEIRRSTKSSSPGSTAQKDHFSTLAVSSSSAMRDVMNFMLTMDQDYRRLQHSLVGLKRERDELAARARELEAGITRLDESSKLPVTAEQMQSDAETLIKILERARTIVKPDYRQAK